jgi:hypothetical protein
MTRWLSVRSRTGGAGITDLAGESDCDVLANIRSLVSTVVLLAVLILAMVSVCTPP